MSRGWTWKRSQKEGRSASRMRTSEASRQGGRGQRCTAQGAPPAHSRDKPHLSSLKATHLLEVSDSRRHKTTPGNRKMEAGREPPAQ